MSSNWELKLVEEIDFFIGDGNYSSKYPKSSEFASSGVPFFSAADIQNGRLSLANVRYISKELHSSLKKGHLKKDDVLLVTRGNGCGSTALVDAQFENANINAQLVLIREGTEVNGRYLYYYLTHFYLTGQMNGFVTGSAQPQMPIKSIKKIPIKFPSLPTQKKIAHILSTLDDKMELNRKMNQTLENMASAIFKSWFVDFDPVHAKANCEDEAELENIAKELGMSKAILDLFPSEFEESELGMIPKGWEATELSQVCKIQSGYAFKSAWWQDTGIKVIKIKNIDGNRVNTSDCECVSEEIATKNSNFKLSSGDLLIAMTGATVGKVGVIYTSDEEYLLNQRVGRFQPIRYYDEYVKIFASSSKFFESIQGQAQGSAQPNISAREIESVKIVKPNDEIMKVFSLLLNPFFSKILEHQGEIQTLEKTRDTLLPKLLSGEIEV